MAERRKVSVVGAGSVGATLAYASLIRGAAKTMALYDIDRDKVRAEVLDLNHGSQFYPTANVIGSDDIAVTVELRHRRDHCGREAEARADATGLGGRQRRDVPVARARPARAIPGRHLAAGHESRGRCDLCRRAGFRAAKPAGVRLRNGA